MAEYPIFGQNSHRPPLSTETYHFRSGKPNEGVNNQGSDTDMTFLKFLFTISKIFLRGRRGFLFLLDTYTLKGRNIQAGKQKF